MLWFRSSPNLPATIGLLLLALVTLLVVSVTAGAVEPFRIGVTLGLTGKYSKLGEMQHRAYMLWQNHANEQGGILGRPVKLIIFDDESNPETARGLYRKLINEKRVDMVFGPYSSSITAAVAPIVEEAGFPMLAAGASSDKIWQQGYKYIFGVYTPASRYTVGMLNLALINDLNTIAIAYANDGFSQSAANGAQKWASKLGLKIVMFEEFEKGQRDLSALAQKIRDAEPSLLMVTGHFEESIDMRRSLKRIGWYPKAYFATVGPVLQKYEETLGVDANLTFASSLWEPNVSFPKSKEFTKSFRARYAVTPTYHAATAYAAGQILADAIKKARSLQRQEVQRALLELETYTVVGRYRVDRTGMQIKHFPLTIQWQRRAKRIVWPEEIAEAEAVFE